MMPFFPNTEMELYSYSSEEFDEYGRKETYTLRETVPVDFQPMTVNSQLREFGKILQDTYSVFIDADVEIHETDKIIIDGVRYELLGSIETWNHGLIPHKEITVQKYRKGDGKNGGD